MPRIHEELRSDSAIHGELADDVTFLRRMGIVVFLRKVVYERDTTGDYIISGKQVPREEIPIIAAQYRGEKKPPPKRRRKGRSKK